MKRDYNGRKGFFMSKIFAFCLLFPFLFGSLKGGEDESNNILEFSMACSCGNEKAYEMCCEPYHKGEAAESALELMRSRYSAYAHHLPKYLMDTTHLANFEYNENREEWEKSILEFCTTSTFNKLEILDFQEQENYAIVAFVAHIMQNEQDQTFTEKSLFEKRNGRWYYLSGQLVKGRNEALVGKGKFCFLPLAYYPEQILLNEAEEIPEITEEIRQLAEQMIESMDISGGMGLAAPQIHRGIKLFVIRAPVVGDDGKPIYGETKVFINPKITDFSEETCRLREGCLSLPTLRGEVERPTEVTISYTDLEGNQKEERVAGWESRVIQHENDHICGRLFIERLEAEDRENIEPQLQKMIQRISL
jgi:peptide deformylase